jgi:hypothetical protein
VNNSAMGGGFGDDETGEDSDGHDEVDERDAELETEVEVTCPYCGEVVAISLDAGGGETQEYVEDCQVCCRPWQVYVSYGSGGEVEVRVEEAA